jgi:modification methylase
MAERKRKSTTTSSFGVSGRESHDASGFYSRFEAPAVLTDETVNQCAVVDQIIVSDSRKMAEVADNSVALVVTSPPYFAGKAYEEELGAGAIPASYVEFLTMLRDVFRECWRVLEPGGRIAVNVANLGRKPYRSLSADVIDILQNDLGFLLRGEIVWVKAEGASGSCAWGSYGSAANPVLRDLSERIIVASKGRFDRAVKKPKRKLIGLPWEDTIDPEDFRTWTLDVWKMPAESAKRVGHPAPFPIELPRRLIELLTYRDDVVLDPFIGAGSTAVAAVRTGRHYVGYDLDPAYAKLADDRIAAEVALQSADPRTVATSTERKIKTASPAKKVAKRQAPIPRARKAATA